MSDPGYTALVASVVGATAVLITGLLSWLTGRGRTRLDEAEMLRKELWEQLRDCRMQLEECEESRAEMLAELRMRRKDAN